MNHHRGNLGYPPSVFRDLWNRQHDFKCRNLLNTSKDDRSLIQRLGLLRPLQVHKGCVNTICWNDTGNLILSGSDDQHLVLTNAFTSKVEANYATCHKANIFSAKFLPCGYNSQIVSCSGDGVVLHTDLNRQQETYHNHFNCHGGTTTYEVMTLPDNPHTFMSCGEDGTVRWFDLREKSRCVQQKCKENILISCQRAITALAVSPTATHQLAVGCADSTVRIYDRRYLSITPGEHLLAKPFCTFVAPKFGEDRHYRITSLNYDSDGKDMLVSYSSDYLYLFNVKESSSIELKKSSSKSSPWNIIRASRLKRERVSPPPVRRLRLRGDWSDTGPDARPERNNAGSERIGQARPYLQALLMQRMTDVLSRMLSDPMTRAALSAGGEDALDQEINVQRNNPESREAGAADENQEGGASTMDTEEGREAETAAVPDSAPDRLDETAEPQPSTSDGPTVPTQLAEPSSSTGAAASAPTTSSREERSAVTSALHNHIAALRDLRQGFINWHGQEPSVSFRLSGQSTSNSTISIRANNEGFPIQPDQAESAQVVGGSEEAASSSASASMQRSVEMDVDYPEDEDSSPEDDTIEEPHVISYEAEVRRKYTGHRNARTMIKEATFWGSNYVMSGSDCGHVFIWDRHTAELQMLLQADQHVVNCLRPHPTLPILATSGIDHDIKLWAPILEESGYDAEIAGDLINRNAIMLEETRDTITVPAAFMVRMLACLNQIRRGSRRNRRFPNEEDRRDTVE